MDNFLGRYQISKLNQDKIDHIKGSITPKEIQENIDSHPNKKSTGPDVFSTEFYQTFQEHLIPILFKLFHKIKIEGTPFNSFYETTISLITRPQKDTKEMKSLHQFPS